MEFKGRLAQCQGRGGGEEGWTSGGREGSGVGEQQGLVFLEKNYPFAFGSASIGRYPSSRGSSYMFNADALM